MGQGCGARLPEASATRLSELVPPGAERCGDTPCSSGCFGLLRAAAPGHPALTIHPTRLMVISRVAAGGLSLRGRRGWDQSSRPPMRAASHAPRGAGCRSPREGQRSRRGRRNISSRLLTVVARFPTPRALPTTLRVKQCMTMHVRHLDEECGVGGQDRGEGSDDGEDAPRPE